MIASFSGPYEFLSNFYPSPVVLDGLEYRTVEHAFQAAETLDAIQRHSIRNVDSPGRAKRLGRLVHLRPDWEHVRVDVMRTLLEQKFTPGTPLAQKLISTYPHELIEGNDWGDQTWGAVWQDGQWVSQNILGRLLMTICSRLIDTNAADMISALVEIERDLHSQERMPTGEDYSRLADAVLRFLGRR